MAFELLKQHLSDLATLTSPDPSLPLLLYIAASPCAVSTTLVQEQDREGKSRQCLVYYVSEVLTASKCNMTKLEKISYAVVMASRKLRHYFEAFKVRVTSDRGLGELFKNPEASARIAKWAAELSGYHITFEPRTSIKSQVWCMDMTSMATRILGKSLDHPLRWCMVPCGGRRRDDYHITCRHQVQILNTHQLCLRVRHVH
jgi:hypothetical protein